MEKEKLSFIPKTSFGNNNESVYAQKQAGVGFAFKISAFLFVLSFISLGGVLAYKNIVSGQIEEFSASLDRAQAAFDIAVILEIEKISSNISIAKSLLDTHRFPSVIFDVIEKITHKNVGFSGLSYLHNPEGVTKVILNGEAKDYVSLAQQSNIFEDSRDIIDFSFLNFSLTQDGHIAFSLEITLNI